MCMHVMSEVFPSETYKQVEEIGFMYTGRDEICRILTNWGMDIDSSCLNYSRQGKESGIGGSRGQEAVFDDTHWSVGETRDRVE